MVWTVVAVLLAALGCGDIGPSQPAALEGAGQEASARAACSACHERDFRRAPQHVDAKPTRCATCHSETAWQPTRLSHAWPLTGAHAQADCASCHSGSAPEFERTPSECVECHRRDLDTHQASHENPIAALSCDTCHASAAWRPAIRAPQGGPATQPQAATLAAAATTSSPGTLASERRLSAGAQQLAASATNHVHGPQLIAAKPIAAGAAHLASDPSMQAGGAQGASVPRLPGAAALQLKAANGVSGPEAGRQAGATAASVQVKRARRGSGAKRHKARAQSAAPAALAGSTTASERRAHDVSDALRAKRASEPRHDNGGKALRANQPSHVSTSVSRPRRDNGAEALQTSQPDNVGSSTGVGASSANRASKPNAAGTRVNRPSTAASADATLASPALAGTPPTMPRRKRPASTSQPATDAQQSAASGNATASSSSPAPATPRAKAADQ